MTKNWTQTRYKFLGPLALERFDFDNGLRLFVVENRIAPVFSYQTWFNVGSRDEVKGKSGLAHLFEHMMFKGTKKNPQGTFDREMESAGARDLNAFTSTDYTAYVASLPVESLPMVAGFESDRMVGLALTKEQFESEREVVHNERKQVMENNPEGKMYEELMKLAWKTHPYGRPVIGYGEDLDSMSTKDCEDFYRAYYAPNNAVICVVGAWKPEKVAAVVHKAYGKIEPQKHPIAKPAAEPPQNEERVSVMSLPVQVEKAYIGYRVPEGTHADHVPLTVMTYILSSGRSSRFYQALVDSGVCMDQGCSVGGMKDPSLLYVSFTCQAGKKADEALSIVDREIKAFIEKGVSSEELERVKNRLRMEIHLGLATNPSMARFIGQHELVLGDVRAALAELDAIEAVTADQVKAVARKYLNKNQRSVVVGKPQ
jgi:zinc protease